MNRDEPGVFPVVFDMSKTTGVNRGEPWRTGKGSPTWVNRVDTVGPPGRTVKDRGAAGVDLGGPGWKKRAIE